MQACSWHLRLPENGPQRRSPLCHSATPRRCSRTGSHHAAAPAPPTHPCPAAGRGLPDHPRQPGHLQGAGPPLPAHPVCAHGGARPQQGRDRGRGAGAAQVGAGPRVAGRQGWAGVCGGGRYSGGAAGPVQPSRRWRGAAIGRFQLRQSARCAFCLHVRAAACGALLCLAHHRHRREAGTPAVEIRVGPRPCTPEFLQRSPLISQQVRPGWVAALPAHAGAQRCAPLGVAPPGCEALMPGCWMQLSKLRAEAQQPSEGRDTACLACTAGGSQHRGRLERGRPAGRGARCAACHGCRMRRQRCLTCCAEPIRRAPAVRS